MAGLQGDLCPVPFSTPGGRDPRVPDRRICESRYCFRVGIMQRLVWTKGPYLLLLMQALMK